MLGPLEARLGGESLRLGGAKQRALLAILLLHEGEVMSADRLIELLWGDHPPGDAPMALQAHVSRLRKLLAPMEREAAVVLATQAPGYALRLGDCELDLRRFQELVAAGHQRLETGDVAAAADAIRQALGLWRGRPLADVEDEPFAAEAILALDDAWLEATEARLDADLALGRHGAITADLQALVRRHPLRERLRGQLMLALYRSGRQAEALDVFSDGRRQLVEELGLEPGRALKELQAAILVQDPALELRRTQPSGVRRASVWRWAAVAVLAALAAAGTLVSILGDEPVPRTAPARITSGSLVGLDAASGEVRSRTPLGSTPTAVTAGEGAVWVLDADDQTVSRVEPGSQAIATFGIGSTPTDLAAGAGALWVGSGGVRESAQSASSVTVGLARVDPATRTVRARVRLPAARTIGSNTVEDHVAVEPDAVWTIAPDGALVRIEPRTNRVVARVRGLRAQAVGAGEGQVWALSGDGTIARIDRETNTIAAKGRIDASAVASLAVGGGSAWVTAPADGTVWRVDGGSRLRMRTVRAEPGVGDVSFGARALWVANPLRGTVLRIDPERNVVTRTVALGGVPRGVAATGDVVYVALAEAGGELPATRSEATGAPVHRSCQPTLFGGSGRPDRLIVADLPLQGGLRLSAQQMADAVGFVLRRRGYTAGPHRVGLQICDDSVARTGLFEPAKCAANARAYVADVRVVGVVGPVNSPCALAAIPALNPTVAASLAMISPFSSYVGLTRPAPGAPRGELASLYPSGRRTFFRVFPADDYQAVAHASLAAELGLRRVAVLDDGDVPYGRLLADRFAEAAAAGGLQVAIRRSWDPARRDYGGLARQVAQARADAVFLGGTLDSGGARVIRALRSGSQPVLLLPDGFTPTRFLREQAGAAAEGAYVSLAGLVPERLGAAGERFVEAFGATLPGVAIEPSAVYAAAAAEVMLDAIARSDGSRAAVLQQLSTTRDVATAIGPVGFDRNGDPTSSPVTILRIRSGARGPDSFGDAAIDRVVTPPG